MFETRRQLRRRLAAAERLAEERAQEIDEMVGSSSWRATEPLRAAGRRLRGGGEPVSGRYVPEPVPPEIPTGGVAPVERDDHDLWQQPWRSGEGPPQEVLDVPAMIIENERRLLHWLARDYWSGEGKILDAGCYLGGSTTALASGLRARPDLPDSRPISSYDLFVLDYFMLVDLPEETELDEGDSFRPLFDAHTAPYEDLVEVRAGDITAHGWSGEPIEVAFIDLMKTWPLNDYMLTNFFGHFIPGRTVLIQQDFVHEFCPWIHVTMGMLDDYFELLDMFEWGSAVYLLREPIPEDVLSTRTARDLTPDQIVEYMDIAIAPATGEIRGTLEVAKACLLRWVEGFEAMEEQLDKVEAEYEGSWRVIRSIAMVEAWGTEMGYREPRLRGKRPRSGSTTHA